MAYTYILKQLNNARRSDISQKVAMKGKGAYSGVTKHMQGVLIDISVRFRDWDSPGDQERTLQRWKATLVSGCEQSTTRNGAN